MIKIVFAAALLAATATAAHAATFEVLVDHSARLPVTGAASVIVSNPKVADVTVVDTRTVYVSGHAAGSTNIVVLDRLGRPVFSSDIAVVRPGSPVAVFHGLKRTDFTCGENCAEDQSPDDANPFTSLMKMAADARTAAGPSTGAAAPAASHP
jgi:hypothetical protein